ncbi:hypothetical protein F7U66_01210 [Vibrio parahaemolyticus]|nr:hypothetical protein [Vibrio parahaemolyticus]
MSRISNEKRKENLRELNRAALGVFLDGGLEALTLKNVAVAWGRANASSVQSYYSSETLVLSLKDEVVTYVLDDVVKLDKAEDFTSFKVKWQASLLDKRFCRAISLVVSGGRGGNQSVVAAHFMRTLIDRICDRFGDTVHNELHELIGRSMVDLVLGGN